MGKAKEGARRLALGLLRAVDPDRVNSMEQELRDDMTRAIIASGAHVLMGDTVEAYRAKLATVDTDSLRVLYNMTRTPVWAALVARKAAAPLEDMVKAMTGGSGAGRGCTCDGDTVCDLCRKQGHR